MNQDKKLHTLPGGGTRSEKAPPYHLTPTAGYRRTALRFGLGAEKHGANNWLKSLTTEEDAAAWCAECFNHMLEHIRKMHAGIDPEDDHLGAIGWAQTVLCFVEEVYGKPWTHLKTKEMVRVVPPLTAAPSR